MQTASAPVTPASGGIVKLPDDSAKLDVPAGAVASTTTITMTTTTKSAPAGITAASPILEFGPSGLVFATPVTVTFTFKNAKAPVVYWSNASGGYDAIAGTVNGSTISAKVSHFSTGFVGEAPSGAGDMDASSGPPPTGGDDASAGPPPTGNDGAPGGSDAPTGGDDASSGPPPTGNDGGTGGSDAPAAGGDDASAGPSPTGEADASIDDASGGGTDAGGSTGPISPANCVSGGACTFGTPMCTNGALNPNLCEQCTCTPSGTLVCSPCPLPIPPSDCHQGATCNPGAASCERSPSNNQCVMCQCNGDGTTFCMPCPNAPIPPSDCNQGAACTPGAAPCNNETPTQCLECMCTSLGVVSCQPCGASGGDTSPQDCQPNNRCQAGQSCKVLTPDNKCLSQCTCGANNAYQCGDCPVGGGTDGGTSSWPANLPCTQNGQCPQPGLTCNVGSPGNGQKCTCGNVGRLSCTFWAP